VIHVQVTKVDAAIECVSIARISVGRLLGLAAGSILPPWRAGATTVASVMYTTITFDIHIAELTFIFHVACDYEIQ